MAETISLKTNSTMNTTEHKKFIYVSWIAGLSFLGSAFTFILAILFSPMPDFSVDPPQIPSVMLRLGQIGTSLLIVGCVAYAAKLTEEKQIMSSVGFTLMSVVQGVIFVLFAISYNGEEKIDEAYRMFSASLYLLVASMVLIAIFSDFPRWVKITGIASCIPYIIENILYFARGKVTPQLMIFDATGNFLNYFVQAVWGFIILRRMKKENL